MVILDGGMGRELQRRGAPFRQPEWSALALSEAPEAVIAVHTAYIEAGAGVITSNSYAVVPFHIGEERFANEGFALAATAGQLIGHDQTPGIRCRLPRPRCASRRRSGRRSARSRCCRCR